MTGNVLFITVDQWRGDCLSALGHPVVETPTLDALAAGGTLFANHWANAAPCGPSRACLYTGTYLHTNRSLTNGTPLDDRFTNVARLARTAGYDPVLFGYTDTSLDPRTLPTGDPRLRSYESVLPGFRVVVDDPWEAGQPAWARWLAGRGVDVPADPHELYRPLESFPGAEDHASTWAPTRFGAGDSPSVFLVDELIAWLERHGDAPWFVHASFIRPHPPYRNPAGYHDRYDADEVAPFVAAPTPGDEAAIHPLNGVALALPGVAAPVDERERRQLRATYYGATAEVDDQLARLFAYLEESALAGSTLVVLTSDHGEMGGDHWLTEKLGYWDESYHVPLIVRDPRAEADPGRGRVVTAVTESVDVLPTLCTWMGIDVPLQADGWPLQPFLASGAGGGWHPEHWREEAHWGWCFADPATQAAEQLLGVPMAHCTLEVARGATTKYVQFATDRDVLPPLLFDLEEDPWQLDDLVARGRAGDEGWRAAERLLQWRMRNDGRELSGTRLTPRGPAVARDPWR